YSPLSLLTTMRSAPVSTLVIVTVAPGSTPPELSTTVPSMVPLAACDCASAGAASHTDNSAEKRILSILRVYNRKLRRSGGATGGNRRPRQPDPFLRSAVAA